MCKMNLKNSHILGFLILVAAACASKKKMTYEFPAVMKENVKAEFLRQCEKGAVLYDINCAKCHNKGRKIPDFTPAQIYGYEIRLSNKQHESSIMPETVTTEELGYILSFLSYKKKSGMPFVGTHPDK